MKEEEAKTKWCPFSRVSMTVMDRETDNVQSLYGNRFLLFDTNEDPKTSTGKLNLGDALCIGSDCMMWEPDPSTVHQIPTGDCALKRHKL